MGKKTDSGLNQSIHRCSLARNNALTPIEDNIESGSCSSSGNSIWGDGEESWSMRTDESHSNEWQELLKKWNWKSLNYYWSLYKHIPRCLYIYWVLYQDTVHSIISLFEQTVGLSCQMAWWMCRCHLWHGTVFFAPFTAARNAFIDVHQNRQGIFLMYWEISSLRSMLDAEWIICALPALGTTMNFIGSGAKYV